MIVTIIWQRQGFKAYERSLATFLFLVFLYKRYFLRYKKCCKIRCLDIIKKTWYQDLPEKEKGKKQKYCYEQYRNLPEKEKEEKWEYGSERFRNLPKNKNRG